MPREVEVRERNPLIRPAGSIERHGFLVGVDRAPVVAVLGVDVGVETPDLIALPVIEVVRRAELVELELGAAKVAVGSPLPNHGNAPIERREVQGMRRQRWCSRRRCVFAGPRARQRRPGLARDFGGASPALALDGGVDGSSWNRSTLCTPTVATRLPAITRGRYFHCVIAARADASNSGSLERTARAFLDGAAIIDRVLDGDVALELVLERCGRVVWRGDNRHDVFALDLFDRDRCGCLCVRARGLGGSPRRLSRRATARRDRRRASN